MENAKELDRGGELLGKEPRSSRTEKCDQGLVFQQDSKEELFFPLPLSSPGDRKAKMKQSSLEKELT